MQKRLLVVELGLLSIAILQAQKPNIKNKPA